MAHIYLREKKLQDWTLLRGAIDVQVHIKLIFYSFDYLISAIMATLDLLFFARVDHLVSWTHIYLQEKIASRLDPLEGRH